MTLNKVLNRTHFYVFEPDKEVTISNDWFKDYPINTLFYSPQFNPEWSITTEHDRSFLNSRSISDDYVPDEIRAIALLLKD